MCHTHYTEALPGTASPWPSESVPWQPWQAGLHVPAKGLHSGLLGCFCSRPLVHPRPKELLCVRWPLCAFPCSAGAGPGFLPTVSIRMHVGGLLCAGLALAWPVSHLAPLRRLADLVAHRAPGLCWQDGGSLVPCCRGKGRLRPADVWFTLSSSPRVSSSEACSFQKLSGLPLKQVSSSVWNESCLPPSQQSL